MLDPKLVAAIEQSFIPDRRDYPIKTKPCRVKFKGNFIVTINGKTIWRNKGFAKISLGHHLNASSDVFKFIGNNRAPDIIKELEQTGLIEFVEVEVEEFAVAKRV